MGKKLLSLSILSFYSLLICAQQEYQITDYGSPGTVYLYNRLTGIPPVPEIILSGDSVTWDLGAFEELNTHALQIVTPGQGMDQFTFLAVCNLSGFSFLECFNIWNQTDQALLVNDSISLFGFALSDLKRFQNKTQNLLLENFFGFTVDFGGPTPAAIVYQSPDTILQFPLRYHDTWSSALEWELDLSATGQEIMYHSRQHRSSEVDSWGTVMTPYDTFTNVIRVRSEILHQDTLFTDTMEIPFSVTRIEYMWFDTSYQLPVMTATGILSDTLELISLIEYIYDATCPPHEWSVDTGSDTFYLDESGTVSIQFIISGQPADTYEWDFGDGSFETGSGSTTHTYGLPGFYSIGVTGCMTHCLPLNSCSGQIIDFEILDTFQVAVPPIPAENIGIKMYPNPNQGHFRLEKHAHVDIPLNYTIHDVWGRTVYRGIFDSATENVVLTDLPAGIYKVYFRSQSLYFKDEYYLRMIVVR